MEKFYLVKKIEAAKNGNNSRINSLLVTVDREKKVLGACMTKKIKPKP